MNIWDSSNQSSNTVEAYRKPRGNPLSSELQKIRFFSLWNNERFCSFIPVRSSLLRINIVSVSMVYITMYTNQESLTVRKWFIFNSVVLQQDTFTRELHFRSLIRFIDNIMPINMQRKGNRGSYENYVLQWWNQCVDIKIWIRQFGI